MQKRIIMYRKLVALAQKELKCTDLTVTPFSGSGSNRKYYRIAVSDGVCLSGAERMSLIGAVGESAEENASFIYLSEHLHKNGLPVPNVIAVTEDGLCYLQDDLGDETLYDHISPGRMCGAYSDSERELLHKTISLLPALQFAGGTGLDYDRCYPTPQFDRRSIMFDLHYFKYCFLKLCGVPFHEIPLEDDFERVCERLLGEMSDTFMHRDFQSRNVMLKDNEPYFIDFQGGRRGPIHYDVASFIWQARARYSPELREDLTDRYLDSLSHFSRVDRKSFVESLRHFVLFRTLQVLGAYGFRGMIEKKEHFIASIPFAIENLREILEEPFEEYPYLNRVLEEVVSFSSGEGGVMEKPVNRHEDGKLAVTISSFSYKGIFPEDNSGNGGGYIFDCRGIPNPGREERFREQTGLDREVGEFLESKPESREFLSHIFSIADMHVENYLSRHFTHLSFSFGCTGGRHRSVWCAERLAAHLHEKYDLHIEISHIARNLYHTL